MARVVRHEATGPIKIDPATMPLGPDGKPKKIAVCACGLSSTFPICDGTHKQLNEQPEQLHCYDPVIKAAIEAMPGSVVMREPLLPPIRSVPPAAPSDASR
jgi:CDGSH-type Zn-finger protein